MLDNRLVIATVAHHHPDLPVRYYRVKNSEMFLGISKNGNGPLFLSNFPLRGIVELNLNEIWTKAKLEVADEQTTCYIRSEYLSSDGQDIYVA